MMPEQMAFLTAPALHWRSAHTNAGSLTGIKQGRLHTRQTARLSERTRPQIHARIIPAGGRATEEELEYFAKSVTGEWSGYEGNFDGASGKVQNLPDYYIPEQFEEWELTPQGFESNHSVTVRGEILYRKFFRILPTVSLFADHVDLEEDFTNVSLIAGGDKAPAIFPEGSFILGDQANIVRRTSVLQKLPSLILSVHDGSAKRRAVNIWTKFNMEEKRFVDDVRIVKESYSCHYCDGADIEGSSGFVDGWVSGPAGSAEDLHGEWAVHECVRVQGEDANAADETVVRRGDDDGVHASLYLPGGIDLALLRDTSGVNNGSLIVQAGWLLDDDTRVVLRRSFDADGAVAYSQRVVETRIAS